MRSVLTNPSPNSPISLIYLESLPWFMKPYLHTLSASITRSTPNTSSTTTTTANALRNFYYRPAIDRIRGTHLELNLTVPAASTLTLTYDFEKAILRYTEYPPDANRGFDVAPAIIRILPSSLDSDSSSASDSAPADESEYLRTTSLLLPLPTPDFSMPYNVIILTSTVIAMGFGSIFNLLVRRFVAADEVQGVGLKGLKTKVWARWARMRGAESGAVGKEKKAQ